MAIRARARPGAPPPGTAPNRWPGHALGGLRHQHRPSRIGRILLAAVTSGHDRCEPGLIAALDTLTAMIRTRDGSRPGWWLPASGGHRDRARHQPDPSPSSPHPAPPDGRSPGSAPRSATRHAGCCGGVPAARPAGTVTSRPRARRSPAHQNRRGSDRVPRQPHHPALRRERASSVPRARRSPSMRGGTTATDAAGTDIRSIRAANDARRGWVQASMRNCSPAWSMAAPRRSSSGLVTPRLCRVRLTGPGTSGVSQTPTSADGLPVAPAGTSSCLPAATALARERTRLGARVAVAASAIAAAALELAVRADW